MNSSDPNGTDLFLLGPIGAGGSSFTTFSDERGMTVTVGSPFPETGNVPEPASMVTLGPGLAALAVYRKGL